MQTFFGFIVLSLVIIWAGYTLLTSAETTEEKKSKVPIALAFLVITIFVIASSAFAIHYFLQWQK